MHREREGDDEPTDEDGNAAEATRSASTEQAASDVSYHRDRHAYRQDVPFDPRTARHQKRAVQREQHPECKQQDVREEAEQTSAAAGVRVGRGAHPRRLVTRGRIDFDRTSVDCGVVLGPEVDDCGSGGAVRGLQDIGDLLTDEFAALDQRVA